MEYLRTSLQASKAPSANSLRFGGNWVSICFFTLTSDTSFFLVSWIHEFKIKGVLIKKASELNFGKNVSSLTVPNDWATHNVKHWIGGGIKEWKLLFFVNLENRNRLPSNSCHRLAIAHDANLPPVLQWNSKINLISSVWTNIFDFSI